MFDANLMYAEKKSVAGQATGAHDSAILVHGPAADDSGAGLADGNVLDLEIMINEDFTSAGAATVDFELQHRDPGGSWEPTGIKTGPIAIADLVSGKEVFKGPIPNGIKNETKLVNTVAVAALTAGSFTSWLVSR